MQLNDMPPESSLHFIEAPSTALIRHMQGANVAPSCPDPSVSVVASFSEKDLLVGRHLINPTELDSIAVVSSASRVCTQKKVQSADG